MIQHKWLVIVVLIIVAVALIKQCILKRKDSAGNQSGVSQYRRRPSIRIGKPLQTCQSNKCASYAFYSPSSLNRVSDDILQDPGLRLYGVRDGRVPSPTKMLPITGPIPSSFFDQTLRRRLSEVPVRDALQLQQFIREPTQIRNVSNDEVQSALIDLSQDALSELQDDASKSHFLFSDKFLAKKTRNQQEDGLADYVHDSDEFLTHRDQEKREGGQTIKFIFEDGVTEIPVEDESRQSIRFVYTDDRPNQYVL